MSAPIKFPVLSINNLSAGYQGNSIFTALNLELAAGEIAAVLGVNGSGKSTLLRTICRLQDRFDGEIIIDGKNITDYSTSELALKVSVVFAGVKTITPHIPVIEILKLGRFPHTNLLNELGASDRKIIRDAVDLLHIEQLLEKTIDTLSDGELQKVLIGRALVQDTELILLDEPTAHLDLFNKVEIFRMIRSLAREKGKTIVFATHEIELALRLADKCLLLDKNKTPFSGPTKDLIQNNSMNDFFHSGGLHFNKQMLRYEFDV